jgi:rSAM/selenodomain-associated transferase 2
MALLSLYDIPAADAVAAAMITLSIKLAWSALGGLVFWREEFLQTKHRGGDLPRTLSVVIPVRDEEQALPETLLRLGRVPEVLEVIVVDGGSRDRTVALAEEAGCRVIRQGHGRGTQLRWGARQARGDVVVLLHADTWLPAWAGRAVLDCLRDVTVVGGGFWKTFRDAPFILRGARFKCVMRLWIWNRIAADQAIFVRRSVLESIGGVPDMPLMEEFVLCDRLAKQGRLALAGATLETSARRFRRHGILRTYLLMGWIHLRFRLGTSPEILRQMFERG